jgi:hypothetical protein
MKRRNYLEFDLQVTQHSTGYAVRVLQSPAGQASTQVTAPLPQPLSIGPEDSCALSVSGDHQQARFAGQALFETIFRDEVLASLGQSLVEARNAGCGLRIKLRLSETPELMNLPWEYLFYPTLQRFLVLSSETTLVHYLDLPRKAPALSVTLPLHILVVIATPNDLPGLDTEQEWRVLQNAMRGLIKRGLVTLERLDKASLTDLQRRLRASSYHVLHYIGHGAYLEAAQAGALMLCDQDGGAVAVLGRDLALLVSDVSSLRLVVLNGCQGSLASANDPFAGVAQALVQQGTPAVLAMQAAISDQAAITLTREFYAALAEGQPVDTALAEARKAIATQLHSLEWGVPRLVTHAADCRLWEIHAARSNHDVLAVQAVDNSLSILAALMAQPDFKAKLAAMQTDFETAGLQIEMLTNYKELHDLLHNLEYLCFGGLVQELRRFPADPLALDILLDHELTMSSLIDTMIEVASRPSMPSAEMDWIQEMVEAHHLLRQAIENRDPELLRRAVWLTRRVLDRHPARINERLNAVVRTLRLGAVEQAMLSIRRDLRQLKLAPQQVRRFERGVRALSALSLQLAQLVEDHDRWQAIDLELRRIEALLNHDLGEVQASWPEVRAKVDPLCRQSGAAWAEWIRRDSRDVDKALAGKNPVHIRQSFLRYRRRVGNRFYQVDSDLKSLCQELRAVGQPLASAFTMLTP